MRLLLVAFFIFISCCKASAMESEGTDKSLMYQGFALLKSGVLKNVRLFGNYSSTPQKYPEGMGEEYKDKNIEPHPAFAGEKKQANNCPADPIAAFVQYLFPSPDGALLTYNQRNSDFWGYLAKKKNLNFLNALLNIVDKQSTKLIKELFGKLYFEVTQKIDLIKEFFGKEGLKIVCLTILKKDKTKFNKAKALLEINTTDAAKLVEDPERVISLIKEQIITLEDLTAVINEIFQAAEINLIAALEYEQRFSKEPGYIYPTDFVGQVLVAFACEVDDFREKVLQKFSKNGGEYGVKYAQTEAEQNYQAGLADFIDKLQNNKIDPDNTSQIIDYTYGYIEYQRPIPDLIQYKTIYDENVKNSYPDCGETSLLNLFYIMLSGSGKGTIEEEQFKGFCKKIQKSTTKFRDFCEFLKKNKSINNAHTEAVHQEWSNLVTFMNSIEGGSKIEYRSPDKQEIKTYNLPGYGGIGNMMAVIGNLIPDEILSKKYETKIEALKNFGQPLVALAEELKKIDIKDLAEKIENSLQSMKDIKKVLSVLKELEVEQYKEPHIKKLEEELNKLQYLDEVSNKLDQLCELCSNESHTWSWEQENINEDNNLYFGNFKLLRNTDVNIIFKFNDVESFVWKITSNHFEIVPSINASDDWKNWISFTNSNFQNNPALQSWYINILDINGENIEKIEPYHLWGLNMSNMQVAARVINFILENTQKFPNFKNTIRILFDKSVPLQDAAAQEIMAAIFEEYEGKVDHYKQIFEEFKCVFDQNSQLNKIPEPQKKRFAIRQGYKNYCKKNCLQDFYAEDLGSCGYYNIFTDFTTMHGNKVINDLIQGSLKSGTVSILRCIRDQYKQESKKFIENMANDINHYQPDELKLIPVYFFNPLLVDSENLPEKLSFKNAQKWYNDYMHVLIKSLINDNNGG